MRKKNGKESPDRSAELSPQDEAATLLRLIEYAAVEARYQELNATAELIEQAIDAFHGERQATGSRVSGRSPAEPGKQH